MQLLAFKQWEDFSRTRWVLQVPMCYRSRTVVIKTDQQTTSKLNDLGILFIIIKTDLWHWNMIPVNAAHFQYESPIICSAECSAALLLSVPSVWLGCSAGYDSFVLGFGRDWVVMGGQCWGALCHPEGSVWWAGIGFICSVYRFVFATRTPHSSFWAWLFFIF